MVLIFPNHVIYTILASTEVSHKQSWSTHLEHTSGYVQSMHKKESSGNLRYLLQELHNNAQRFFKNLNNMFHFLEGSEALLCFYLHQNIRYLNDSFCTILCTYPEVCSICVLQDCLCDTSVLAKMV